MTSTKEYKKRVIEHLVNEVCDSSDMWSAIMDDQDIGNKKQKKKIQEAIYQMQLHIMEGL